MEPKKEYSSSRKSFSWSSASALYLWMILPNHLGMRWKTLYQYFADKDEMVMGVVDGHILKMGNVPAASWKPKMPFMKYSSWWSRYWSSSAIWIRWCCMIWRISLKFTSVSLEQNNHLSGWSVKPGWGIKDELYRPDINVDVLAKYRIESHDVPFNIMAFPPVSYFLCYLRSDIWKFYPRTCHCEKDINRFRNTMNNAKTFISMKSRSKTMDLPGNGTG